MLIRPRVRCYQPLRCGSGEPHPLAPSNSPLGVRHADAFAATPGRARAGLGARAGRRHAGPCRQDSTPGQDGTPAGQPAADRRRGRVSAVQHHRQEGPAGRLRRRYRQCLVQIDQRLVRAGQAALGPDDPRSGRRQVRSRGELDVDHGRAPPEDRLHRPLLSIAGQVRGQEGHRPDHLAGRAEGPADRRPAGDHPRAVFEQPVR